MSSWQPGLSQKAKRRISAVVQRGTNSICSHCVAVSKSMCNDKKSEVCLQSIQAGIKGMEVS